MNELLLVLLSTTTFAVLSYGFLIGIRHAAEADHLAAVSTIIAREKSIFSSATVGAIWGLGHTISLLIAGALVLLLNIQISATTERILEFCVGVTLTLLGFNALRKMIQGQTLDLDRHSHADHLLGDDHKRLKFSSKPLIVGIIHGLAGSAALMLIVIPLIDSALFGMIYLVVFGVGSIAGMAIMTMLVSLPFQYAISRSQLTQRVLQSITVVASSALGLWIVFRNLFQPSA
jgi:hypothetical protein